MLLDLFPAPLSWVSLLTSAFLVLSTIQAFLSPSLHPNAFFRHVQEALSRQKEGKGTSNTRKPLLPPSSSVEQEPLAWFKYMYHAVQNLERHADVLPQARESLLSLFAESLHMAKRSTRKTILHLEEYNAEALTVFINGENDRICHDFDQYIARRNAGGPRELFMSSEDAVSWLRSIAPAKCVDGAWLGYVHGITTPFGLRSVTKNAWQVMSEELGDGDLNKNHAHVYSELLKSLGIDLPRADHADFIHPRHQLDDLGTWKSAVSQLLISLFPHEFLPEILGFNLHFELLTWDTICAAKELRELGIDDQYFLLHVCIDNAHSGHTAMATRVVIDYLRHVAEKEGTLALRRAWKRVQSGYVLSEFIGDTGKPTDTLPNNYWNIHAPGTLRIMREKAYVSQKLHCNLRTKIDGRSLVDWLDPVAMRSDEWAKSFLEALSLSKAWVKPGDSGNSRLTQALSWTGKMFGAFSDKELEVLRAWIDNLLVTTSNPDMYWSFTGRDRRPAAGHVKAQRITCNSPVIDDFVAPQLATWLSSFSTRSPCSPLIVKTAVNMKKLMPLWFAQISLLERMITIPIKTCSLEMTAIIRLVRAQRGFLEGKACAGIDEMFRDNYTGLHELGMEMMSNEGLDKPKSLEEIFSTQADCKAALKMMHMSMRPIQYGDELIGMTSAFVELQAALCCIDAAALLTPGQMERLEALVVAERRSLQVCVAAIQNDQKRHVSWRRGYQAASREIEKCFA